jgi:antitoxin VapB
MSLEIVDTELDDLAREVAEATGESVADAVKGSLRERLERVKPEPAPPPPERREVSEAERQRRYEALMEFGRYFRSLPVYDERTPDEIIGYDENGLPT